MKRLFQDRGDGSESDDCDSISHSGMDRCFSSLKTDLNEIRSSGSILRSLVSKGLFGHYKNSTLGFAWHFFQPMLMMLIYYIVFTEIRSSPIPDYWVYLSCALFPFSFMLSNLTSGSTVITGNSGMVKKMYFPREILVMSQVITSLIVMVLGYSVVLIIDAIVGHYTSWSMLLIPVFMVSMAVFVTGYVFLFSSLNVYVRDVQYFLGAISMVFMFMTPMYFMADSVSGILGTIIWLNPFTYYVEAFHALVYFGCVPSIGICLMCVLLPVLSMIVGYPVFRRLKKGFVERL